MAMKNLQNKQSVYSINVMKFKTLNQHNQNMTKYLVNNNF